MAQEVSYSRQAAVFEKGRFDLSIDVIGLGGVASYLVLQLKKLGVADVRGFDAKVVATNNPPYQLYGPRHAGVEKAQALIEIVEYLSGGTFEARSEYASEKTLFRDVVFMCVDSMETRKQLMHSIFQRSGATRLVIETRVDANYVIVHTLVPSNADHREEWDHSWFADSEAQNNFGCADPVSLGATSSMAADVAVSQLIQWFGNGERDLSTAPDNQIRIKMRPFSAVVFQW